MDQSPRRRLSLARLDGRLKTMPFVKALVPFAVGVALGFRYLLPLWFVAGVVLAAGLVALKTHRMVPQLLLLLGVGSLVGLARSEPQELPFETPAQLLVRVESDSALRNNRHTAEGRLTAWCDPLRGEWHSMEGHLLLRSDTTLTLCAGERLLVEGRIYPFRYGSPSFRRLMYYRNYLGSCYLRPENLLHREAATSRSLHQRAAETLGALLGTSDAAAVVRAMTVGDRSGVDGELRAAYARSGMSHLLAVSGLHMGIVFLLINLALGWLVLLHRGEVVRNLLAIVLIWIYLFAVGAPASAVRAAIMCSILQLSFFSASSYYAMNAWAASAMAMLMWRPAWLLDIGFQLSFVAVAALLLWGVPLCTRCRSRFRPLNALLHALIIGCTASLATAPLTSYAFGLVPLVGFVLNPVVVFLGTVVVGGGLTLLLLPFLTPMLAPIALTAASWLNRVAEKASAYEGAALEEQLSGGVVGVIYLLFLLITLLVWSIERKKSVHL